MLVAQRCSYKPIPRRHSREAETCACRDRDVSGEGCSCSLEHERSQKLQMATWSFVHALFSPTAVFSIGGLSLVLSVFTTNTEVITSL